jgi:hypothetical protein
MLEGVDDSGTREIPAGDLPFAVKNLEPLADFNAPPGDTLELELELEDGTAFAPPK